MYVLCVTCVTYCDYSQVLDVRVGQGFTIKLASISPVSVYRLACSGRMREGTVWTDPNSMNKLVSLKIRQSIKKEAVSSGTRLK